MAFPQPKRLKRSYSSLSAAAAAPVAMDVDMSQNRAIASLKRRVRSLSSTIDVKNCFTSISDTGVGTAGLLTPLDVIAQGDSSLQRDSLAITPIELEWNLLLESEVADSHNTMRMMIVQSKGGAVLTSADFGGVLIPTSEAQRNRYTILYDKLFNLENFLATDSAGTFVAATKYYLSRGKVKVPRKIHFPDAGSTSNAGSLYVWFISDSSAVAHPDVETFESRLTYKG